MTLVLFGWLVNQQYFQELTNVELRKAIYKARLEAIEQETLPVGFYNDGNSPESVETWIDI